ncbi:hypothetical protein LCGC14_1383150 [marine sediment metagenome]|uniref:dATP/dGTP diphosphohydrolase N-terminal domain-containing protein n=1 Tax=marine sediment metagenome TaxID=412755 RepID=A0A0F9KMX2_9ZZZZ
MKDYDKKLTNPKDAIGSKKLPLHLVPDTLTIMACPSFLEGALKYGQFNWRVYGVRLSIYISALERHLKKYKNGEDRDPKTLVHHLSSVIACAAIILDAEACKMLTDDRPPHHPTSELIDGMMDHIAYLKDMYKDQHPHQNTHEDSLWAPEKDHPNITKSITPARKLKNSERLAIKRAVKQKRKAK